MFDPSILRSSAGIPSNPAAVLPDKCLMACSSSPIVIVSHGFSGIGVWAFHCGFQTLELGTEFFNKLEAFVF